MSDDGGRAPQPADDTARATLAARARALARVPDAADDAQAAPVPVVAARRAGIAFALPAADVVEVRRAAPVAALPGATLPVAGLAAWRGRSLVVHDVFGRGLAPDEATSRLVAPWLLVVARDEAPLAFVADDVDDIVALRADHLRAPPDGAPPSRGATDEGLLLLDLAGWIARQSSPDA